MKRKRRRGFTLVETLAAFTILALVFIQLFDGLSLGVRNDVRAEADYAAVRLARSELARVDVEYGLAERATSGVSPEGLRWTMNMTPYLDSSGKTSAYWVEVVVRSASGVVALTTLKRADPRKRTP